MKEVLIIGINGSPRKMGNTAKLLIRILKGAKKSKAKTSIVHLVDKNIKPCLGCYSISPKKCKYPCVQNDDMQEIYKLLIKADGIVLASPAYWFNVSGLMKNFIDRLTSLEVSDEMNNTNFLRGKVGGCLATAEETGGDEATNYMVSLMNEMGLVIPPFATPFFNLKHKGTWMIKDLEILGENITRICNSLKEGNLKLVK